MTYQKALVQFAMLCLVLPLVLLIVLYVIYGNLQDQIAEHQTLYTKLTALNSDIAAAQKQVNTYQVHRGVLDQIQTENLRNVLPDLFNLLAQRGFDKDVLQYRIGFNEDSSAFGGLKQFSTISINLQLVGRFNPLLQTAYALEASIPTLVLANFTLVDNSPPAGLHGAKIDQPLSLTLNYGTLNMPPVP